MGRPKGSKNKPKATVDTAIEEIRVPKKRGRKPGSRVVGGKVVTSAAKKIADEDDSNYAEKTLESDVFAELDKTSKEDIKKATAKREFKDFHIIMDDYHSGDPERVMRAKEDACENLKAYIAFILIRNFHTYCKMDFQDMMQCGMLGILEGLKTYNPDRTMPTTFFKPYIKSEISTYITEYKNHTTTHYAAILSKLNKAITYFEANNIPWDNVRLAEYCNIPLISVDKALKSKEAAISVNYQDSVKNFSEDDGLATITHTETTNPEKHCMLDAEKQEIARVINETLTDSEKFVILARYGFNGNQQSHSQIAKALGITVLESKALQQRALNKLRNSSLNEWFGDAYASDSWLEDDIEFFPESESEADIVETIFGASPEADVDSKGA